MRLEAYKVEGVLTGPLVVAGFALSLRSPRSDPRGNRMPPPNGSGRAIHRSGEDGSRVGDMVGPGAKEVGLAGWFVRCQRAWLRWDQLAGLTTAAVVVPQAGAYALLAGLPVQGEVN
jgi:hypothetical protein